MKPVFQIEHVQPDGDTIPHNETCNRDLETQVQQRHGVRLNTPRQACACVRRCHLRIVPTSAKSRGGDFPHSHSGQTRASKLSLRAHSRKPRCASQPTVFSRWTFIRFRQREVVRNSRQAVIGRPTMACYPPHVSKVVSYPHDSRLCGSTGIRRRRLDDAKALNLEGMKAYCGYGNKVFNSVLNCFILCLIPVGTTLYWSPLTRICNFGAAIF